MVWMKITGAPESRAAASSDCNAGIIAFAAAVGAPALPSEPSASQKSFCTSTTMTAAFGVFTRSGSVFVCILRPLYARRDGVRPAPAVDDVLRRRHCPEVLGMNLERHIV